MSKTSKEEIEQVFKTHVPFAFSSYMIDLFCSKEITLKLRPNRKTKLGDFRPLNLRGTYKITINKDLNPYSFLITSIHEFSHLVTFEQHQGRVKPHGLEWRDNYRSLLRPVIEDKTFPKKLQEVLIFSLFKTRVSSCLDYHLYKELSAFDAKKEGCFLEKIKTGTKFSFNGRIFVKLEVKRTRALCLEEQTKKKYMIHFLAHVKPIISNEK